MPRYSLHTRTDDQGCHVYLVPVDSDGDYRDRVAVGDPLVFTGRVAISSDDRGRKILEAEEAPTSGGGG